MVEFSGLAPVLMYEYAVEDVGGGEKVEWMREVERPHAKLEDFIYKEDKFERLENLLSEALNKIMKEVCRIWMPTSSASRLKDIRMGFCVFGFSLRLCVSNSGATMD